MLTRYRLHFQHQGTESDHTLLCWMNDDEKLTFCNYLFTRTSHLLPLSWVNNILGASAVSELKVDCVSFLKLGKTSIFQQYLEKCYEPWNNYIAPMISKYHHCHIQKYYFPPCLASIHQKHLCIRTLNIIWLHTTNNF